MTNNGANTKIRRFKNRHLELFDIVDRFESSPASKHTRDARAVIERVKDERTAFWKEGSSQLRR